MGLIQILWDWLTGVSGAPGEDIDWNRLAKLAEGHGMAALAAEQVRGAGSGPWEPQQQRLAAAYYRTVGANQLVKRQIDQLGAEFKLAGLGWLPVKGAALAWSHYPDPGLRPMNDIDVLVRPEDVLRAVQIAKGLGYELEKLSYHALMNGGEGCRPIEIHWCLPGGDPFPEDFLEADGAEEMAARQYLYCLAHLLRQHGSAPRLIWHYDLHLLKRCIQDETMLEKWAQKLGMENELQVYQASPLTLHPEMGVKFLDATRRALRLLPGKALARLVGTTIFPPAGYMKWRYQPRPEWIWPVYYGRRLMEWAREVIDHPQ